MGEQIRFIYLIKPIMFLIPEIPKPPKNLTKKAKKKKNHFKKNGKCKIS